MERFKMRTVTLFDSARDRRGPTMRVARIMAPGLIEIGNAPLPKPREHQVRVRIAGCGVCASNLPVWQGRPWFKYPLSPGALGHEGWGWIDLIGPGVDNVRPGAEVAFLSSHAYAEYDIAEAATLVPLPAGSEIFPGEALGCAANIFRRSDIHSGQTVAIIGIGFIGALLVQMIARHGAQVIAISRRPFALDIARRFGAGETIIFDQLQNIVTRVMERTRGRGCERVIEAVGEQQPLDLAGELVAVRGRLIIAGYHQDSPRSVNMQLWNWRGIDVVNAHEREPQVYVEGMRLAAEKIANGALDPEPLYTHGYGLQELSEAFAAVAERPHGFLKAWIRPGVKSTAE